MVKKEKGVKAEKLNWFMQMITLGDRFSWRDFYDRLKEGIVSFFIVFFGVLVSFGVEQKGAEFDDRTSNIENLVGLRDELKSMNIYTQEYRDQVEWISDMYKKQYLKWEEDNDTIFVVFDDEGRYAPMSFYTNRDPFDPPRVVYDAIKLDGTFRFLGPELGRRVNKTYDGTALKYIIENTASEEKTYIEDFENRIKNKWVFDIKLIQTEKSQFWIENRRYIQKDKYIKYNLLKRIELWEQIMGQLEEYTLALDDNIKYLDSVITDKEKEYTLVYWVFRPHDFH
ncbi:MAG: hypothetical protein P8M03_05315 [Flavobacteriaceae bacterium]|nr:hypothetical protein [Flavobacteriaceae bacterium]